MKHYIVFILSFAVVAGSDAATTVNSTNKFAWGANVGWIDCRGDATNGAVIGQFVCSGSLYAANVGWISLGNGSPPKRIQYLNNSASDFGVNHDGEGNLRGYAYGANIGWINFESNGAPKINLLTGELSGFIYSANCGWISLSNAYAHVQSDTLSPGLVATNGLPVAWLLSYFGTTNVNPTLDPDGDGLSNQQEYVAGTNPNDTNSVLSITGLAPLPLMFPDPPSANLSWKSMPTRLYIIEISPNLSSNSWSDSGLGLILPDGFTTSRVVSYPAVPKNFFRVRAVVPLQP